MLGWALIINNLGRRRYPLHWWSPESVFVRIDPSNAASATMEEGKEKREEEEEGEFVGETLEPEDLRRESELEEIARTESEVARRSNSASRRSMERHVGPSAARSRIEESRTGSEQR